MVISLRADADVSHFFSRMKGLNHLYKSNIILTNTQTINFFNTFVNIYIYTKSFAHELEFSIFYVVHGAGATKSSVPGLQKALISRYKYCFRSSVRPSGSIIGGRAPEAGTSARFSRSMNDCCGELTLSL